MIITLPISNFSARYVDCQITGRGRNDVNLENPQYLHPPWNSRVRVQRHRSGDDVGEHRRRLTQQPVRHDRERDVHVLALIRVDPAGGNRRLPDQLASVVEQRGAVRVAETDLVRVRNGDGGDQSDVDVDGDSGYVERDGEIR